MGNAVFLEFLDGVGFLSLTEGLGGRCSPSSFPNMFIIPIHFCLGYGSPFFGHPETVSP